ncbi:hypothetical protein BS47DRAFT_1400074 [Hydnum rufescens UP504]|uniref:Uncharacterized protein n=1 Tax=Hydnum rufescens UP504 TaxID=1448309 RepID=A0A9P6AHA8_9AGAM|nr:hypothetical protein BS47DRAFT_1400074 [Hydnum rufescens UP504]
MKTDPRGSAQKEPPLTALAAEGTVPSLRENPPDKHPDEPAVCAATQARNSRPPNTTIDDIAYHTPAAAGVW